ncbi:MAG TPA: hypothetical protein PKA70_21425 [Saprospiraceae bacterium]|nr:hypothetical protein [Saprospiraceae bacterium]
MRAAFSNWFRSPDWKELFFNFNINYCIVGNPCLRAENSGNGHIS